ncbi:Hypothetical predicted protein [Octopus vulgaris]|uniref:Uncharacterized protein n=1 Tax=Octopus vulgaris TaxID=6645 RepID=A0AA36EZ03_OCTVU|nr:Hypothetical predicted protein [Octopus vulgaris]
MKLPRTSVCQIPQTPSERIAWQRPIDTTHSVTVVYRSSDFQRRLKCVRPKEKPSAEIIDHEAEMLKSEEVQEIRKNITFREK